MSEYKLTTGGVIRLSDRACIPADRQNRDYAEYLLWRATGGVPLPADPITDPRIAAIEWALDAIDRKSIRALRDGDQARIAALETEACALRVERQEVIDAAS